MKNRHRHQRRAEQQHKQVRLEDLRTMAQLITEGRTQEAGELVAELQRPRSRHDPRPRAAVSEAEFVRAQNAGYVPKMGRQAHKMNVDFYLPAQRYTPAHIGGTRVEWTCPNCGHRNDHLWTGRAHYVCAKCDRAFDVKGTPPKQQG